jgi:membrane-associated phospholipid phosphatase
MMRIATKPVGPGIARAAADIDIRGYVPPEGLRFTGWTIENRAIAAIAEFAALVPPNWRELCDPGDWLEDRRAFNPYLNGDGKDGAFPDQIERELNMLYQLMDYRDGVMSEAMAQALGIIPYFQGLAGFTAASHPETTNLCIIALNLGQFMVMYYKNKYNRPRPSQLLPALLPSMEVPGHASYPSGHSTETHLIANLLQFVIGQANPAYHLLQPLADRISINREVMGLHYRSDSEGGVRLAELVTGALGYAATKGLREAEAKKERQDPILYKTLKASCLEWLPDRKEQPDWKFDGTLQNWVADRPYAEWLQQLQPKDGRAIAEPAGVG